MGEHRIEVDHLRWLPFPGTHTLDGVAAEQVHARHDRSHFQVLGGSRQAVLQQGGDQRLALDQGHLAAQAGQHEGVLAQARSGIEHARAHALGDAHGLGDHLPITTTELAPVGRLALDEVDPHRSWRLWPELLNLQALWPDLHGKACAGIDQRQAQALRPAHCLLGVLRRQRLDPQTCALLLLLHHTLHSKI